MKTTLLKTALLSAALLIGCVTLKPEQKAYLAKAAAFPNTFRVPKTNSDLAWQRAQVFVANYSSMKIQTSTPNVLETYTPFGSDVTFGYSINRLDVGDSTEFNVKCVYGNMFSGGDAVNNAHLAALYIATGEMLHPELIHR
jgi:hypothetical protein